MFLMRSLLQINYIQAKALTSCNCHVVQENNKENIRLLNFKASRSWPFCADDFHKGPGGRLNKKDGLTRYGNSHVKDKTS